jgi:2-phospho-L-lactate guanylyltransferase
MTIWAAIPVKPLAEGKSRLANALSQEARLRLNANLFKHTLAAVGAVFPPACIIVVTRDSALREIATAAGMQAIAERGVELNAALFEAATRIPPADGMLAISTDMPDLTPEDIFSMLAESESRMVIAPDRAGKGTNALLTIPAACIPFRFGPDSFASHLSAATARGINARIVNRPGLAFDLDTEADLPHCPPEFFGSFPKQTFGREDRSGGLPGDVG